MAFVLTYNSVDAKGLGWLTGSYVNDGGSTGGTIRTPFGEIDHVCLQPLSNAVVAKQAAVNASFFTNAINKDVLTGKDVVVKTNADESGLFLVIGK